MGLAILEMADADGKALRAGLEAARRSLNSDEVARREGEIKRALARDMATIKTMAERMNAAYELNAMAEKNQREHRQRLEDLVKPACALPTLQISIPTPKLALFEVQFPGMALEGAIEACTSSLRRIAEMHSAGIAQIAESMRLATAPDRDYLRPLSYAAPITRPWITLQGGSRSEPEQEKPRTQTLRIPQAAGPGDLECNTERLKEEVATQQLLQHLNRFVASEELSSDIRVGLSGTIAWFKLHQHTVSPEDGQRLNLLLYTFVRDHLGLDSAPELQKLLNSGLLIPKSDAPPKQHDLDPKIYEMKDIIKELKYNDGTIRRKARRAWNRGPGPQRLDKNLPWFVVAAPENSEGGRGCGWKFQKLREDAEPKDPSGRVRKSA